MGFLFFIILVIVIVNVANNSKNKQNNISSQHSSYSTPNYNSYSYNRYNVNSNPKLNFHSKTDSIELFGYTITNSLFYTCNSSSNMPFAINTKSNPNFDNNPTEGLNYWPNYNQINQTQQGYYF